MEPKSKAKRPTPFERFQELMRRLVAVPKKEVEAEEERWRAERQAPKKETGT
jgi:hypothetical protein